METNTHEEIMRAIGRLEGKVDGINTRLDIVNGRLGKHADRLNYLERNQDQMIGKLTAFAGVIGFGASVIWGFISKKFDF